MPVLISSIRSPAACSCLLGAIVVSSKNYSVFHYKKIRVCLIDRFSTPLKAPAWRPNFGKTFFTIVVSILAVQKTYTFVPLFDRRKSASGWL